MGDRLATTDMGRKEGGCCAPFCGGAGHHLTQYGLGRGLTPYTKWHLDPPSHLDTLDMGRKVGGGLCPYLGELDPYLTQSGLGRGLPAYQVTS